MDPATIIALVEVSGALVSLALGYFSKVKSAKEDIGRLITEVTTFQNTLKGIQKKLQDSDVSILSASNSLSELASACLSRLKDVENTLNEAMKKSKWGPFRSLKWPFTSREVDQIINDLERYKNTISLELQADHM
jgi:DNA anti-recombination protein RmuC